MRDSHLPIAVMTVGSRRDDRRLRPCQQGGKIRQQILAPQVKMRPRTGKENIVSFPSGR